MSYDLAFLRRRPGQSWEEAIEVAKEPEAERMPDEDAWTKILAAAQQILGDVTVESSDHERGLNYEHTGIELWYWGDEATISAEFWPTDEPTALMIIKLYRLGRAVEEATGLQGYDQQLDMPLTDASRHSDLAVKVFDSIAARQR